MSHPLAIIAYNRPDHLRSVLEALAPQKPEPLYVFCDGPVSWDDQEAVDKRNAVLNQVTAVPWTVPIVNSAVEHVGLRQNVLRAVDIVLGWHDTVIVLEDDCIPGPHFMEYMNTCLDKYANRSDIISIGAYTPPLPEIDWPWDVYFIPRIETWGWATWKDRWGLYVYDIEDALKKISPTDLSRYGNDVPHYIKEYLNGKDIWSPGWLLAAFLRRKYCVYPTTPHVMNIGRDPTTSANILKKTKRYPPYVVLSNEINDSIRRHYSL